MGDGKDPVSESSSQDKCRMETEIAWELDNARDSCTVRDTLSWLD